MTVADWGKGRPDYMKAVIASRPQVIIEESTQVKWSQTTSYVVSAQGVSISNFYTVPTNYTLELGGGFISCKDSCINKLRLVAANLELIGEFRFDMQGILMFSSLAGQLVTAENTITAYIYNNDTLTSAFSLTLSGVLIRT